MNSERLEKRCLLASWTGDAYAYEASVARDFVASYGTECEKLAVDKVTDAVTSDGPGVIGRLDPNGRDYPHVGLQISQGGFADQHGFRGSVYGAFESPSTVDTLSDGTQRARYCSLNESQSIAFRFQNPPRVTISPSDGEPDGLPVRLFYDVTLFGGETDSDSSVPPIASSAFSMALNSVNAVAGSPFPLQSSSLGTLERRGTTPARIGDSLEFDFEFAASVERTSQKESYSFRPAANFYTRLMPAVDLFSFSNASHRGVEDPTRLEITYEAMESFELIVAADGKPIYRRTISTESLELSRDVTLLDPTSKEPRPSSEVLQDGTHLLRIEPTDALADALSSIQTADLRVMAVMPGFESYVVDYQGFQGFFRANQDDRLVVRMMHDIDSRDQVEIDGAFVSYIADAWDQRGISEARRVPIGGATEVLVNTGAGADQIRKTGDSTAYIFAGTGADRVFAMDGLNLVVGGSGEAAAGDQLRVENGVNVVLGDDIRFLKGEDIWEDAWSRWSETETRPQEVVAQLLGSLDAFERIDDADPDEVETVGGFNLVVAGIGDDRVRGGRGVDVVFGNAGRDAIDGGDGFNFIVGGSNGGSEPEQLQGGKDTDVIVGDDLLIQADFPANQFDWIGQGGVASHLLQFLRILQTSTTQQDALFGSDAAGDGVDSIDLGDGLNIAFGGGGGDTIIGGDGWDLIMGGPGDDPLLQGGMGVDVVMGNAGDDTILGGADETGRESDGAINLLFGDTMSVDVHANFSLDSLVEGKFETLKFPSFEANFRDEGDDQIVGGASFDWIVGGKGGDTIYGNAGGNLVFCDEIEFGPLGKVFSFTSDVFNPLKSASLDVIRNVVRAIQDMFVARQDGIFVHTDLYVGGPNTDIVIGGRGNDRLYGNAGFDFLIGGNGLDYVDAGPGGTTIAGEEFLWGIIRIDNVAYGGPGNDEFLGGQGNDVLMSDAGDDRFQGGAGDDILAGGSDADEMFGEDGDDLIFGESGDDRLFGGEGHDAVFGGDGDDFLLGESGNDSLYGEKGLDELAGGAGVDDLFPGTGSNRILDSDGMDSINPSIVNGPLGDFDRDQVAGAVDFGLFCAEMRTDDRDLRFDMNADGRVDLADLAMAVAVLLRSSVGDANLDGAFDSSDLVMIFQAGEYEDLAADNSTWSTGDWDCDGDFTTADLVFAFQQGSYVS